MGWIISRRDLVRGRRYAPALQLAFSVMLGQVCAWFSAPWMLISVGLIGGACLIRFPNRVICGVIGGSLLGIASTLPVLPGFRPEPIKEADGVILARVVNEPRRPKPGEIIFEVEALRAPGRPQLRCRAIDLPWRNSSDLLRGDVVWIRGEMTPVERSLNPFSWQGWLWRRGVASECRARYVSKAIERNQGWFSRAREWIHDLVDSRVEDSQGSGLFLSMALGYHDLLSTQVEGAFMRLGLTHLLVVSGYQVSLMFGFVFAVISYVIGVVRIGGLRVRAGVAVASFIFATAYVCFIGAEMSSVRALVAAACISATIITERNTSFAQRWGVALLAMQLIWPWCAFDIGVILTFAALLGIGLGSEFGSRSKLTSLLSVTVCVWIMTSLVVIVWQGMFSPIGLLLNLVIAAPWSIINCVGGLLGLCALMIGVPGAAYPMKALAWINSYLAEWALVLAESSYGGFKLGGLDRVAIASVVALIAAIVIARFVRSASSRIRGVADTPQRWI